MERILLQGLEFRVSEHGARGECTSEFAIFVFIPGEHNLEFGVAGFRVSDLSARGV